jgi:hypothetical protein
MAVFVTMMVSLGVSGAALGVDGGSSRLVHTSTQPDHTHSATTLRIDHKNRNDPTHGSPTPGGAGETGGETLGPTATATEFTPHRRAFYTVFSPMLDSPDWPSKYEEYSGGLVRRHTVEHVAFNFPTPAVAGVGLTNIHLVLSPPGPRS